MTKAKKKKKKSSPAVGAATLIFMIIVCVAVFLVMCGGDHEEPYKAPDGDSMSIMKHVNNDTTGKWRLATTTSTTPTMEYVYDYYKNCFESDDEIHFIINFTLGTTTRISDLNGILSVYTTEHVEKEETNAKTLGKGYPLSDEVLIYSSTGEVVDLDSLPD